jgi:hypothetical protein
MSGNYQQRAHRVGDRTFDQQRPAVADEAAADLSRSGDATFVMLVSSYLYSGNERGKGSPTPSFFGGKIGRMTAEGPPRVHRTSGIDAAWGDGDEGALNRAVLLLYPELRRISRQHLARRFCRLHAGFGRVGQ